MFPLSDSAKTSRFPLFTILIIALNVYVFYLFFISPNTDLFINQFALIPSRVNFTNISTLIPFVTAMFLHGGFIHIISNMWFLWIFGDNVEGYLGYLIYPLFYLTTGIIGNGLQYFLDPSSSIPMLGASGAISGILGAYYVLFPKSKVKTVIFIFIFFTVADIPAVLYLFYWFFLQLISGIGTLGTLYQNTGGVAFWAHIGGFVSGVLIARAIKNDWEKGYIEGEIV